MECAGDISSIYRVFQGVSIILPFFLSITATSAMIINMGKISVEGNSGITSTIVRCISNHVMLLDCAIGTDSTDVSMEINPADSCI